VSVQYGSHVWSTLLIPVNKGQQRCGLCFFCLRGIFCGPSQLNIFRRKLFFSVRWPMMRWAKKFRGPGSGLENLVFDSTYGPVAYSLLLDHKGPGRSPARKTKFSRPQTSWSLSKRGWGYTPKTEQTVGIQILPTCYSVRSS
jgi:hypothetical protein